MPQTGNTALFFEVCTNGNLDALRGLLAQDPDLVRIRGASDATGLHAAARRGHAAAVRLLIEQGADPNVRESGDNTYPLHWAAAGGHVDTVRELLHAGADVEGVGDLHELDVIGWATYFHPSGGNPEVLSLLLQHGACHHIFSAIAVGDLDLVRKVIAQDPNALARRMSHFERGQAPLHFAASRKRYDILDLLIQLGADVEREDKYGHTALELAMLDGDQAAMRRLRAAGAKPPMALEPADFRAGMEKLAKSVRKNIPMLSVPDVAVALDWYSSVGFKEISRYADDGQVNFGMVAFGNAELMLTVHGKQGPHDVSLWFYTDQIDLLYQLFKSQHGRIEFVEYINDPFYGGRQFGVRDVNGYTLYFLQTYEKIA